MGGRERDGGTGGREREREGGGGKHTPIYFTSTFYLSINIVSIFSPLCIIIALCADGQYYKYNFNSKGESYRESYCKFLQMTDD